MITKMSSSDHIDCLTIEPNTLFELTERFLEEPTKLANGNAVVHRDQNQVAKLEKRSGTGRRRRIATFGIILLIIGLLAGLAVPLALRLRASSLLEARLNVIKRILQETPLIQGTGNRSDLATARLLSIDVPCGSQYLDAVQLILEKVDEAQRSTNEAPLQNVNQLRKIHLARKSSAMLGIQGGHALGDSLGVLRTLHSLGIKFVTLTHGCSTVWAGSGLTEFGQLVVQEMNRLGILIDLSHSSEDTILDVLKMSTAPVIFSRAGSATLCNDSSTISDAILGRLAANGGAVLIGLEQCKETKPEKVIAHINRIRTIAGLSHVGLAGDGDPSLLLAELVRDRHWGTAAVKQLVGGNMLRVLDEVESKAKPNVTPNEEWIPIDNLDGNTYCRYPGI